MSDSTLESILHSALSGRKPNNIGDGICRYEMCNEKGTCQRELGHRDPTRQTLALSDTNSIWIACIIKIKGASVTKDIDIYR